MNQDEMAVKLAEVDARSKSNTHRIDALEKSTEALNKLATAVEVMATRQESMAETLERLDGKVEIMEQKPAKRWEGLAEKALWAVCAAVIAFLLAKIGLQ